MLDHGNGQLSAVGFFNPGLVEAPVGDFFGGAPAESHPQPYEVQWDGSLDGGSGGWKICLPTGHLLSFDGTDVDTSTFIGVSAIPDAALWYSLDGVGSDSSHVWLVVTVANSTEAVASVRLSPDPGQGTAQTTVYNVCVAELSVQGGAGVARQSLVGALHIRGDSVPPDGISVEHFTEASQSGERKLQIKGFRDGSPADEDTLADYLQKKTEVPSSGILVLCRRVAGPGARELFYMPVAPAVYDAKLTFKNPEGEEIASFSANQGEEEDSDVEVTIPEVNDGTLTITQGAVTKTFTANQATDESVTIGDGTLTITQGAVTKTFTANQATDESVTIGDGTLTIKYTDPNHGVLAKAFTANQSTNTEVTIPPSVVLTDVAPATPVLDHEGSTQNAASAGISREAARADHVHKLPTTVVDTVNAQDIGGAKRFTQSVVVGNAEGSGNSLVKINAAGSLELSGSTPFVDFHYGNSLADFTSRMIESESGVLTINSPNHARLGQAPITDPSAQGYNALQIATVGDIKDGTLTIKQGSSTLGTFTANQAANQEITIAAPPSGSVVVLRKVKYDVSTHKIMAAYSKINLATGAVTAPGANEIPADDDATLLWAEVTEAVPHSTAAE